MTLTIGHMATYMKKLLPVEIPSDYPIHPVYLEIASEEAIRRGVIGVRDMMQTICDGLIADEALSAIPKKGKDKAYDETTLTVEFPFINNIRSILLNIGQYGVLTEEGDALIVDAWDHLSLKKSYNKNSTTKISTAQMLKTLRFLASCGMDFQGIDLGQKKPDLDAIKDIRVSYVDASVMPAWKVLGLVQYDYGHKKNDDILLRCDYRMLTNEEVNPASIIEDFVYSLAEPLQDMVRDLHKTYISAGMGLEVNLGAYCTHLIYTYKKKPLWRFSRSFHMGDRLVMKTKNAHKYPEVVDSFTPLLRDTIRQGYGCDRQSGTSHGNCSHACEGFRFSLDEAILAIGYEIKTWQTCELASMNKRR